MKRPILLIFLSITVLLSSMPLMASNFDGSKSLLCVTSDVNECHPVEGCKEIDPDKINAPRFLSLDFSRKTIKTTVGIQYGRESKIKSTQLLGNKLILQGIEQALEDVREGLGWTLAIDQSDGDMIITGTSDNSAFVLFGVCTLL